MYSRLRKVDLIFILGLDQPVWSRGVFRDTQRYPYNKLRLIAMRRAPKWWARRYKMLPARDNVYTTDDGVWGFHEEVEKWMDDTGLYMGGEIPFNSWGLFNGSFSFDDHRLALEFKLRFG